MLSKLSIALFFFPNCHPNESIISTPALSFTHLTLDQFISKLNEISVSLTVSHNRIFLTCYLIQKCSMLAKSHLKNSRRCPEFLFFVFLYLTKNCEFIFVTDFSSGTEWGGLQEIGWLWIQTDLGSLLVQHCTCWMNLRYAENCNPPNFFL